MDKNKLLFSYFRKAILVRKGNMKDICILDKKFRELIPEEAILKRAGELAEIINRDYRERDVVFLAILNGAFIFAADLFKKIDLKARITFVKFASYSGTCSSGSVVELIGLNEDLIDKEIIILEDIVDSGDTLEKIVNELLERKVKSVSVAAMFLKPDSYKKNIPVSYIGFEIPPDFVVGYGLDYDGFGRNLPSVYALIT
ncbi:MAG: hypoxanthine phosphoribosyltransferase [Bacteroidales bacterium]|jgi:hypoxanthine phosphoribosyltransferase|nr:hypoxanthine phosphoribosyltransferase [Bacteroidales bacterium]